jgi:2-iminobutanoate/2-iminopropanoate deaminase
MARSIELDGLHHGGMPIPVAARVGPLVVSGGISGMDRSTGTVPDGLEAQVANLFDNIGAVIAAAGGTPADIAKVTIFAPDRSARDLINEHWVATFPDEEHRPARHTLVQQLPGSMLVQAEIVAFVAGLDAS